MQFDTECVYTLRDDLQPGWVEVQLGDELFLETDVPAGTEIITDVFVLETIEDALPRFPVLCRIVLDKRQRANELLIKYSQERQPTLKERLTDYILRRLGRKW